MAEEDFKLSSQRWCVDCKEYHNYYYLCPHQLPTIVSSPIPHCPTCRCYISSDLVPEDRSNLGGEDHREEMNHGT